MKYMKHETWIMELLHYNQEHEVEREREKENEDWMKRIERRSRF